MAVWLCGTSCSGLGKVLHVKVDVVVTDSRAAAALITAKEQVSEMPAAV